jgi:hypothetical protein
MQKAIILNTNHIFRKIFAEQWIRIACLVSQYFFENQLNACEIRKVNNNNNNNNNNNGSANNNVCESRHRIISGLSFCVSVLGPRFRPLLIPPSSNISTDIFPANRIPPNVSQPRTLVCSVSLAVSILLQRTEVCVTRLLL